MRLSPSRRAFGPLLITVCVLLAAGPSAAAPRYPAAPNPRLTPPQSRLHEPFDEPVYLTGHLALDGTWQYGHGRLGYGASFIFRPGASSGFLDFLYDWHTAMVLRVDYQGLGAERGRALSGDFILRPYFGDRHDRDRRVLPFVGLGVGATDVRVPSADGGGNSRYWSWLVEAGQEWSVGRNWVVVARLQYRRFSYGGVKLDAWAVNAAVGFPVPW